VVFNAMGWVFSADNELINIIFHKFSPRGRQEYKPGNINLLGSSVTTNNSGVLLRSFHLEARKLM